MLKHELRERYKKRRSTLDSKQILSSSIEISNNVQQLPIWKFSFFHTFLSIFKNNEVDTNPLITLLMGRDKHIVVPKMGKGNSLTHILLTDATVLKPNHWNIPEPQGGIQVDEQQLDVVFVPLLAFDEEGHRIGYGKGFYDQFLAKCRDDVIKVGLSFFGPVSKISDTNEEDVPLNFCVTPDQIYSF